MGSSDYSGEDDKIDVLHIHPDRHGADPTEGWRRGTRGALRKSCDACTNSKTKCCGDIPCDRCKKRNLECKFSKRRRCGPKARPPEEKRPRTEEGSATTLGSFGEHSAPDATMVVVSSGGDGDGNADSGISNANLQIEGPLPLLPVTHRGVGFSAPMTTDGLSGLVGELMGPSLSDGGGSGSSGVSGSAGGGGEGGGCKDSTFQQATPGRSAAHFAQPPAGLANGQISFLSGEASSPRQRNDIDNGNGTRAGTGAATLATTGAVETRNTVSALNKPTPSPPGSGINRQPSLRSSRRLTSSHSAPIPITLPPRGLPARSKSVLMTSGQFVGGVELGRAERWEQAGTKTGKRHPPLPSRGTLPLSIGERPKAHLRTFMRSVGSIVLLPGTEALREATNVEDGEGVDSPVTASVDAMSVPMSGSGRRAFDPMQVTETNGSLEKSAGERSPAGVGSGGNDRQELDVDAFAEASRAEAWAAVAVGALFSGAGVDEAKMYISRALGSLAQCLDASLPEVASVMVLLTLFWMHSMDNRKMLRYFGFAQQVGLELGPLMPEGLRHTMAFMSVMIKMSLELDHETSLAVQVKDPATWSVTQHSRPGGDPFVDALETVTMVCSRILQETASARRPDQGVVNGVSKPPAQAQPPSKALTDMLKAAADVLNTSAVREGEQAPDHMLALVYGLIGYTHAARNEMDQATASAKLILEVIDRHPAVLHLPLTYTLAEASSRLVRVRGTSFPANHVESLRVARASLVFARPPPARGDGGASSTSGGWCAFGDHILATFEKGVVREGRNTKGNGSSKVQVQPSENSFRRAPPSSTCRSASMSPPQERSARSTFRPHVSGQGPHWPSGGSEGNRPARSDQGSSSPRWHESTDWVDRVRNMPILAGSPNPGITRRALLRGGNSQAYNDEHSSLLNPGPMPPESPTRPGRYASEPAGGLALLSVVAAPGMYSATRGTHVDVRLGDKESSCRRGTEGRDPGSSVGLSGNGSGGVGGVASGGDDSDDLPPAPPMTSTISFDPNREDPNFPLL